MIILNSTLLPKIDDGRKALPAWKNNSPKSYGTGTANYETYESKPGQLTPSGPLPLSSNFEALPAFQALTGAREGFVDRFAKGPACARAPEEADKGA